MRAANGVFGSVKPNVAGVCALRRSGLVSVRFWQARYNRWKRLKLRKIPLRDVVEKDEFERIWPLECVAKHPQLQSELLSNKYRLVKEQARVHRVQDVEEYERQVQLPKLENDWDRLRQTSLQMFEDCLSEAFLKERDTAGVLRVLDESLARFSGKDKGRLSAEMQRYLREFEKQMRRHCIHTAMARLSLADENGVNQGSVDVAALLRLLDERVKKDESGSLLTPTVFELTIVGLSKAKRRAHEAGLREQSEHIDWHVRRVFSECERFIQQHSGEFRSQAIAPHLKHSPYLLSAMKENSRVWKRTAAAMSDYLTDPRFGVDRPSEAVSRVYDSLCIRYGICLPESAMLTLLESLVRHADPARGAWDAHRLFCSYLLSNRLSSPGRRFFNRYLRTISVLGDLDTSIMTLRLMLFGFNNDMKISQHPRPDSESFANVLASVKHMCAKDARVRKRYSHSDLSRKVSWVLQRMSDHRCGAKDGLLLELYECLGVSFWEHLTWEHRGRFRPKTNHCLDSHST